MDANPTAASNELNPRASGVMLAAPITVDSLLGPLRRAQGERAFGVSA